MNIFISFFHEILNTVLTFWSFINGNLFCVLVQTGSLVILSHIIFNLTQQLISQPDFKKKQMQYFCFIFPIIAIMTENFSWILGFACPKTILARTALCIAWILSCFKLHSFVFFLQATTEKKISFHLYHKIFLIIETVLCFGFIADYLNIVLYEKHVIFFQYFYNTMFLVWLITLIPLTSLIVKKIATPEIPIVIKKQIHLLFTYLIIPYAICLIFEFLPFVVSPEAKQITAFTNIGIILIALAFYLFYKKIMLLRFLNLSEKVQNTCGLSIRFTPNIKEIIDQLNFASNSQELQIITQNFFYEQIHIEKNRINLYIRNESGTFDPIQEQIEQFLNNEQLIFDPIKIALSHKIFISHEIDFDAFYSDNQIVTELSSFLKNINCDLFIPILNNKQLTAYIIVKKEKNLPIYNLEQQNKMIVFAQFLAPAIYLLSQKNIYKLMQEAKEIKEDLYAKHQEVNQYKESIKKLLKDRIENHIGIIFYKQKHFSFRNQEAQQLIGVNPNIQQNHPTTATLINLAQQVEKFKSTQTICMTIHNGNKLIVSAMPYTEPAGGVILTVRQPEATDIIKLQLDALKDPSKRDFLLYLETTEAGKLINKLLPSKNETLLQIKIELLQAALQKNALLLQSHPDDVTDIATLIHQISLKESMHIVTLQGSQNQECATKLFGINSLLQTTTEQALLEKLDSGTLLIKNIEYLDTLSQQKLAYFIRYGIFTPLKSEQRKFSDVRIICATKHNIQDLLNNGQLIPELYKELQKSSLCLPSLLCLTQEDLCDLIDGFMYQALQDDTKETFVPLNIKDKDTLLQKRIESITEFKKKIYNIMALKSQEQKISHETIISKNSFDSACPELQLAAQLGKDALKDSKLMTMLWEKLGSQTKIADLLGVNRSSVNRRCKDYNLI